MKDEDWTGEQWGKALFSDESLVQRSVVHTRHVRRPPVKRFDDKCTISTMKHPPSQVIWGAMCNSGTVVLSCTADATMNGEKYVELLKGKAGYSKCTIFMHGGAPCYRSKQVKNYLTMTTATMLVWPGNSPDLNRVENLWVILVADRQPPSANALVDSIKNGWIKISVEYCRSLISINLRCIQSRGGQTKH